MTSIFKCNFLDTIIQNVADFQQVFVHWAIFMFFSFNPRFPGNDFAIVEFNHNYNNSLSVRNPQQ